MPLLEQMNRLAVKPITHLHKKNKHHERTSSYYSDRENSDESNSHRNVRRDLKAVARKVKRFVAHKVNFPSPGHSKKDVRSRSLVALSAYNANLQYDLSDQASDADVHSSVYDSDDSEAALSRPSQFNQHRIFDEYDDASQLSLTTSKAIPAGSAHIVHGPVHDTRSRMRERKKLKMENQIQTGSEHNKASTLRVHSENRSLRQLNADTSVITENQSGEKLLQVIPREGFFWQILLYIRLARALYANNFNGNVDAYVKVKYRGDTLLRTSTIRNNRNPVWDQRFQFPINNLNYPLELRVYHRDTFKKNMYIGSVLVYPATLTLGLDKEFSVALSDETERNTVQPLGELNFWITLNEIECMRVPNERRRIMLKQMKEDRQVLDSLTRLLTRSPSEISQVKKGPRLEQLRWESFDRHSLDTSRDSTAEFTIGSMDEYEIDFDEWLLPSAASFHQPQWPLAFYDGTNVEMYTANVADKTQCVSISKLISVRSGPNDIPLGNSYNRARLVVNLIRAENLSLPSSLRTSSNPPSSDPVSKLMTGHGVERAIVGLPINHTDGSLPSFVATLSIGKSWRISRAVRSSDSPCWHQHFEFRLKLGKKAVLNVEITDQALAVPTILFRGYLDFERQIPDWTNCFTLKNTLEGYGGHVTLLVTLTGLTYHSDSVSDELHASHGDVNEEPRNSMDFTYDSTSLTPKFTLPSKELLCMVESHYSLQRTLENKRDVGWLHLVVRSARELASVGRSGQLDPYCYLRLVNRCVHTATIYKTTNPSWNQAFVFPISDIYDVLEIVVLHSGKHCSELLGRLSFPIIQLANRQSKWYTLKDKKLRKPTRGAILLESFFVYNPIRAAMRVVYPREEPLVRVTSRIHLRDLIRKYLPELQQKIDRITPYGIYLTKGRKIFKQLYNWEKPMHSSLFLAGIWIVIIFVQPYMIIGGLLLGFAACWLLTLNWFKNQTRHRLTVFSTTESEDDDVEEYLITEDNLEDDSNSESDELVSKNKPCHKKGLKVKLAKAREVLGTLQIVMESVASTIERIDCLLKWQVPWLSVLFFLYLIFNTLLAYFVPARYILLIYVTKLFTSRLSNFKYYDFSALSIISRVPNKLQRIAYRELHPKGTRSNS